MTDLGTHDRRRCMRTCAKNKAQEFEINGQKVTFGSIMAGSSRGSNQKNLSPFQCELRDRLQTDRLW